MRRRAERLERAASVADKIWRLQQAKLSRIDNELAALHATEIKTLDALSMLEPKLLLDRISSLSQSRQDKEMARAETLAAARESGRRVKLIERLHTETVRVLQREERAEQNREGQRPVSSSS